MPVITHASPRFSSRTVLVLRCGPGEIPILGLKFHVISTRATALCPDESTVIDCTDMSSL
jgi:hypothetical protein